jgi:beta-lactamase class A
VIVPWPLLASRRALLGAGGALLLGGAGPARDMTVETPDFTPLERRVEGRLGVSALDVGRGRRVVWRPNERFPMCSTFKALLAAAVLARVDAGVETLDRRIAYGREDLVAYSPVVEARLAGGSLSVEELCRAIVQVSDNAAANLLLKTLGGPAGLTAWLRDLGDRTTRLDRYEPDLNVVGPRDPRDSTTPGAMVETLRQLLAGRALSTTSRARLMDWMTSAATGLRRLRAATPTGWRAGDKTGTGENGTNDIGFFQPPGGGLVLVCAFLTETTADLAAREAALADAGRIVLDALAQGRG